MLEIPDFFFLGEGQKLGPSLRMQKKWEYPPGVTISDGHLKNDKQSFKNVKGQMASVN